MIVRDINTDEHHCLSRDNCAVEANKTIIWVLEPNPPYTEADHSGRLLVDANESIKETIKTHNIDSLNSSRYDEVIPGLEALTDQIDKIGKEIGYYDKYLSTKLFVVEEDLLTAKVEQDYFAKTNYKENCFTINEKNCEKDERSRKATKACSTGVGQCVLQK